MTEIAMRRKGGTLTSVDQVSDDELRNAAREGQDVLVVVRTARNPRQHRLAWALAQKIADAADFKDRDDAMDFLKIKARHVRYIADPRTEEVHIIPKSIAFASCSQAAFNRLMNRFVWVVCSEILPGVSEDDLRREIEEMVEDKEEGRLRQEFSRKVKAERYFFAMGRCEGCDLKLTKTPHYDHDTPCWLGGDNSYENCRVLCQPCHKVKTAAEAPQKAKGDRIRDKAIGAQTSRWTIPGSRKSPWKRKMDGTVVRRD